MTMITVCTKLSRALAGALLLLPGWLHATPNLASPKSLVVLPFEVVDDTHRSSLAAADFAQDARLQKITEALRQDVEQRGMYRVVDTGPVRERVAAVSSRQGFRSCEACALEIGRSLGAQRVAVGWVQTTADTPVNINLEVLDVRTGEILYTRAVDLRGNTDANWMRGVRYLVDAIAQKNQQYR